MLMILQMLYRSNRPVHPGIYLVQVLSLSASVVDASPYLVPQALINVLRKPQDADAGESIFIQKLSDLLIHDSRVLLFTRLRRLSLACIASTPTPSSARCELFISI